MSRLRKHQAGYAMRAHLAVIWLAAILSAPTLAAPPLRQASGTVVAVTDGDTLKVLTVDHKQVTIRLAEIDAPESHQPYGDRSKQDLARLTFGKQVTVSPTATDRYGRTVARISADGRDVGTAMIRLGAAWVFVRYSSDPSLPQLEKRARAEHLGLWRLQPDQRLPPWEWRETRRTAREQRVTKLPSQPRASVAVSSAFSCSAKRYCSQMTSCDEAIFHLKACGQARLDRDGDGKPCERLCQ